MTLSGEFDVAIVGAGAAGLMAGIWAGRSNPRRRIVILDGADKLGAKILVAGGGRCNVTHYEVRAEAYAGSSRNAIQKALRRFDVSQTVEFFRELGVELKREETGKLFPVTDSAKTVLDALLRAVERAKVTLCNPWRVETIAKAGAHFRVVNKNNETIHAKHVVLAAGGRSLPKSGSDGHGYEIARSLGHRVTPRIFPALVPLTLPQNHFIRSLSGITLPATIELRSGSGKKIVSFTDSTLCTHFGLSGPSILDFSRYYLAAKFDEPDVTVTINWLPGKPADELERELQALGQRSVWRYLGDYLPERMAKALCEAAGVEASTSGNQLTREARKALVKCITQLPLPITGDRGYTYAEVTAGGIPLSDIRLETMESRICPGLTLCGEICDVDGRIGGYNFQWAWSSGYVAGVSVGSD